MEKRVTPGKYVPNGLKRSLWQCDTCGSQSTTGTWRAHDGEEGTWCVACSGKQVKSVLRTVEVDDVQWVRGKVEVKCCGQWLECCGFTNTCDRCNRDYNGSGQLLAHRSQWGEETGESLSDILNIP